MIVQNLLTHAEEFRDFSMSKNLQKIMRRGCQLMVSGEMVACLVPSHKYSIPGLRFTFQVNRFFQKEISIHAQLGTDQKKASDIWALGTEEKLPPAEYIRRVTTLPPAELPLHYPERTRILILRMFEKDPSLCITAEQAMIDIRGRAQQ
ncbi:MAG: hypothetical protein EZS28_004654 [Streblomastix strix]|uniref:Protein kinase domain-containing protein n=1 Tax=Streblomastix strix TaxID=222440 RepID=A0A5J4WZP0_9EUKA|nr:MAG: hypothetical protein EZS28_004654 [Streblomastix strix]